MSWPPASLPVMDVILVPGLWLDATSWDEVLPPLESAGLRVHPLTMPGIGIPAEASAAIGLADWVAATVAAIDRLEGPVVLVGHSGGGSVVWGAADARVDRVSRVVFVDCYPPAEGGVIGRFPVVDGVIPFPGWDSFAPADIADLDAEARERWAARTASIPARVPTDPLALRDTRRLDLPVSMLTATFPEAAMRKVIAEAPPWAAELAGLRHLDIIELGSGHWPQFSRAQRLAEAIVRSLRA